MLREREDAGMREKGRWRGAPHAACESGGSGRLVRQWDPPTKEPTAAHAV